jgi:hypothetical protein
MLKKVLIAIRGDSAEGAAAKGDFAPAKSAAATSRHARSARGNLAEAPCSKKS